VTGRGGTRAHALVATAIVALAALACLLSARTAEARTLVTVAARTCPTFADVPGNRTVTARPETIGQLGQVVSYILPALVDPAVERAAARRCAPLTGWRFTLGGGTARSTAPDLPRETSIVTSPTRQSIVTRSSVPLRDTSGRMLRGGRTLAGATTVSLSAAQSRASARGRLWIQGGTPADPVSRESSGPGTEFAALRCGLRGPDLRNAQAIRFPAGTRHLYCFAYYVGAVSSQATTSRRPTAHAAGGGGRSMTITFTKQVPGAPADFTSSTVLGGSLPAALSPSTGTVTLEVRGTSGSTTIRGVGGQGSGATGDWTVTEENTTDPRMSFDNLVCTSRGPAVNITVRERTASIQRVNGANVTCTWTNSYVVLSGFTLLKKTVGATGRFDFVLTRRGDNTPVRTGTVTTEYEGELAGLNWSDLPPGDYTLTERTESTDRGRWSVEADCGTVRQGDGELIGSIDLTLPGSGGCLITNRWTPAGSIALYKVTHGGLATVGFQVISRDSRSSFDQSATTQAEDTRTRATGDPTDHVELGEYTIQEFASDSDDWVLASVDCNGELIPFTRGLVRVTLTAAEPSMTCVFVDVRRDDDRRDDDRRDGGGDDDEDDGGGGRDDGGGGTQGGGDDDFPGGGVTPPPPPVTPSDLVIPLANVTIEKHAVTTRATLLGNLTYVLRVTNRGPSRAEDVVINDDPQQPADRVRPRPSQGRCTDSLPLVCFLGALDVGDSATVRVTMRPTRTGIFRNDAIVSLGTYDPRVAVDNEAMTRTPVLRARRRPSRRPGFTG
jgi:hypothetical protein